MYFSCSGLPDLYDSSQELLHTIKQSIQRLEQPQSWPSTSAAVSSPFKIEKDLCQLYTLYSEMKRDYSSLCFKFERQVWKRSVTFSLS